MPQCYHKALLQDNSQSVGVTEAFSVKGWMDGWCKATSGDLGPHYSPGKVLENWG